MVGTAQVGSARTSLSGLLTAKLPSSAGVCRRACACSANSSGMLAEVCICVEFGDAARCT